MYFGPLPNSKLSIPLEVVSRVGGVDSSPIRGEFFFDFRYFFEIFHSFNQIWRFFKAFLIFFLNGLNKF